MCEIRLSGYILYLVLGETMSIFMFCFQRIIEELLYVWDGGKECRRRDGATAIDINLGNGSVDTP